MFRSFCSCIFLLVFFFLLSSEHQKLETKAKHWKQKKNSGKTRYPKKKKFTRTKKVNKVEGSWGGPGFFVSSFQKKNLVGKHKRKIPRRESDTVLWWIRGDLRGNGEAEA